MKQSLLISLFCLIFGYVGAQTPGINYFYHSYKRHEDVKNFTVPGWVIRLGSTIASSHVDEPEAKAALKMAKKVKKLRLLVMEGGNPVDQEDVKRMLHRARGKEGFEDMLFVSDKGTKVNMLIRSKGDMIKNLLILVSEEDQFVMVSLKSRLKISDLNELLQSLESEVDIDLGIDPAKKDPEKEPKPAEEEIPKKKPKKDPARA